MISHNYTDWYDVQLFGIPAYGTGQVSYSVHLHSIFFITIYHDFTTSLGVYAIFFQNILLIPMWLSYSICTLSLFPHPMVP